MPRQSIPATFAILICSSLIAQGDFKSVGKGVEIAGNLFFVADRAAEGQELWIIEAGQKPARLIKDIHPGSKSSEIGRILALGNRAVFVANDGVNGRELWSSDGTEKGTSMVKDIQAGGGSAGVDLSESAATVGSTLYFFSQGPNPSDPRELWKTDGTAGGTETVKKFARLADPVLIFTHAMTALPDGVVVFRMPSDKGPRLWRTDGTAKGTEQLCDVALGSTPFGRIGKELYFGAGTGDTWDIWLTDGTKGGTKKLHGAAAADDGKLGGPATTRENRKLAMIHFVTYCATCHGKNGKGTGPAAVALNPKPRDWTDAKWQASVTDKRILQVVRDGGAAVGLSPLMAPNPMYGKNPAVLKAIVEKIRSFDKKK